MGCAFGWIGAWCEGDSRALWLLEFWIGSTWVKCVDTIFIQGSKAPWIWTSTYRNVKYQDRYLFTAIYNTHNTHLYWQNTKLTPHTHTSPALLQSIDLAVLPKSGWWRTLYCLMESIVANGKGTVLGKCIRITCQTLGFYQIIISNIFFLLKHNLVKHIHGSYVHWNVRFLKRTV